MEVLGTDIPACNRADMIQDTYLTLLNNTHLVSIERRGKLLDYTFTIVKNKVAKYYAQEHREIQFDDIHYVCSSEEGTGRWYE